MSPKSINNLFLKTLTEHDKEIILLSDFSIDLVKSNSESN